MKSSMRGSSRDLTLSLTEHNMAYNAVWADGAFAAADAGINAGINKLSASTATSTQAIPVSTIATRPNAAPWREVF